jgi:3-oxoacyl-[acyl-carrier protein] reductase
LIKIQQSKVYLSELSRNWAHENIKYNIVSNTISPFFMLSELDNGLDDRIIESLENSNLLRELLPVKAFADVIKSMGSYTNHVNGFDQIIYSNKI